MFKRTPRSVSLAHAHLKLIAKRFEQDQRAQVQPMLVTVTKQGRPVLTIVPQELYDGLLEPWGQNSRTDGLLPPPL
jgi:hypothetical protein